jgi:ABC-type iron transport system FetAB ATPase subunit
MQSDFSFRSGVFAVRKGDWILIQGTSGSGSSSGKVQGVIYIRFIEKRRTVIQSGAGSLPENQSLEG